MCPFREVVDGSGKRVGLVVGLCGCLRIAFCIFNIVACVVEFACIDEKKDKDSY